MSNWLVAMAVVVAHDFNPSTWKVDARGTLRVQGQSSLQSEFQSSQVYTKKSGEGRRRGGGNMSCFLY
jgi:hypothetical protein